MLMVPVKGGGGGKERGVRMTRHKPCTCTQAAVSMPDIGGLVAQADGSEES